jgi:uncharacterized protein YjiS (DUF1127 family)
MMTKENAMSMMNNFRAALAKRALYVRTRNDIRDMSRETGHDLGIFVDDADQIAWRAVYG